KEKIIQSILDDVLHHIVTAILRQKPGIGSQVPVGQRFPVHIFQYLLPVRDVFGIELIPQLLVKSIVKVVLYHLSAEIGPAPLIPKDIPDPRTVLCDLLPIEITGKTTRTQIADNPFRSSAKS